MNRRLLRIVVVSIVYLSSLHAQKSDIRIGQSFQTVMSYLEDDAGAPVNKIMKLKNKIQVISSVLPNDLWEYQFNGATLSKILIVASYKPEQALQSTISMATKFKGPPKTINIGNLKKYYWNVPGKDRIYLYLAYHSYYGATCMITEKVSE